MSELQELLRQNSFFQALPGDALEVVESNLETRSYKLGNVVVEEGDLSDGFYLIRSGKARVVVQGGDGKSITLATLTAGSSFGEQSLLYDKPAGASVRAAGTLVTLRLPAASFKKLAAEHPAFRNELEDHVHRYSEYNFLRKLNLLSGLNLKQAREVADKVETIELADGDFLFHEGDDGDAAYIVRDGRVRIVKESKNESLIAVLSSGALIGEMSLLYSQPRTAGAKADGPATILRISRDNFERIVSGDTAKQLLLDQAANRIKQQEVLLEAETQTNDKEVRPTLARRQFADASGTLRRRRRVFQTNHELLDGLACLATIDEYYGQERDWQPHIDRLQASREPDSLRTLSRKAEGFGYLSRLMQLDVGRLRHLQLPAIVETLDGQMWVILALRGNRVSLAHPRNGVNDVALSEFEDAWTGRVLSISYVPNFSEEGSTQDLLRRFAPMARPYLPILIWIAVITLLVKLLALAGPLFTKVIIDEVLVHGDRALLVLMLIGMFFVTGFQVLSNTLNSLLTSFAFKRLGASLLLRFLDHVLSLPHRLSGKWQSGDLLLRFQENEKLLQLISNAGFRVLVDSVTVLLYIGVLFSQSIQLTVVALGFVGAYAVLMLVTGPMLRANDRVVFDGQNKMQSFMIESVSGVQTIKGLAREQFFLNRGKALFGGVMNAEFKGAKLGFTIGLISRLLNQASTLAVLGYGAFLALQGELTAGELVAFSGILGLLLGPLLNLVKLWDDIQEMRVSFERVDDVLSEEIEREAADAHVPSLKGHVRFENLSFRYNPEGPDILSDLNAEILPGQKIALVGRSGSGKSTLVNLIIKILEPTGGKLQIDDMDLSRLDGATLRRQIGVVEQHPYLFNGTIRENIGKAAPDADLDRIVSAATLAGAHEFIDALPMKYNTQIGERGMSLSGGQRQRIVIARALVTNPAMLVLDEATAALDTETERIIQKNLDTLTADRTVFVIAHRLSTVRNADQIFVMDEGRIVEQGSHDELMTQRGLYFYMHEKASESPIAA